jgi:hypothetical protein
MIVSEAEIKYWLCSKRVFGQIRTGSGSDWVVSYARIAVLPDCDLMLQKTQSLPLPVLILLRVLIDRLFVQSFKL